MADLRPFPPLATAEADTWASAESSMALAVSANLTRRDGESDELWSQRIAAATLASLCSCLGGQEWYIPRLPAHHRAARDTQLRLDFNGGNLDEVAASADLSPRHTRRLLMPKI